MFSYLSLLMAPHAWLAGKLDNDGVSFSGVTGIRQPYVILYDSNLDHLIKLVHFLHFRVSAICGETLNPFKYPAPHCFLCSNQSL
jgi:hypothetical protein